jgi:hypothetical protein
MQEGKSFEPHRIDMASAKLADIMLAIEDAVRRDVSGDGFAENEQRALMQQERAILRNFPQPRQARRLSRLAKDQVARAHRNIRKGPSVELRGRHFNLKNKGFTTRIFN